MFFFLIFNKLWTFSHLHLVEKEAVRQLISTAIKGLEDNGRIHPTAFLEEQKKSTPGSIETINTVGSNK